MTASTSGVTPRPSSRRLIERPLVAALVLLVAYVVLAFAANDQGFLGTDTGGKVATVKVMSERGDFDPDVRYWAEQWDPEGRVHGLYYTSHLGERYINVTSLPMVLLARPLWDVGGYRATLALPMLGGLAAAFAARALARRVRAVDDGESDPSPGDEVGVDRAGWLAFWVIGLASPVAVYALDLWEHSLGLALMAWAFVALFDAVFAPPRWWRGALAGLAFGTAAAMRTESFVYTLVATALACGVIAFGRRRDLVAALVVGVTAVAGFAVAFGANLALETAVLGEPMRSARASGAASGGLTSSDLRVKEGLVTFLSPFPDLAPQAWVSGACLLAALVLVALRSRRPADRPIAVVGVALAGFLYLWRFTDGLGFVPGLIAATPFAAAGLALGWDAARSRFLLALGLAPVPVVVAFQFTGGAAPQWAGRYLLASGLVLSVVGLARADRMARWARTAFVVASVSVTAFGLAWLVQRSHDIADTASRLQARPEAVLISPDGFIPREFGATYGDKPWLASGNKEDLAFAVEVVGRSGAADFAIVALDTEAEPRMFPGWQVSNSEVVPFVAGAELRVTTYVPEEP